MVSQHNKQIKSRGEIWTWASIPNSTKIRPLGPPALILSFNLLRLILFALWAWSICNIAEIYGFKPKIPKSATIHFFEPNFRLGFLWGLKSVINLCSSVPLTRTMERLTRGIQLEEMQGVVSKVDSNRYHM